MDINFLKQTLVAFKQKKQVPENRDDLINHMLKHIGSIDSTLRDDLIYPSFASLIFEEYLTAHQLEKICIICMDDNHLFYRIGETNTDSVFTRSFSALILVLLLEKDRLNPSLPAHLLNCAIDNSLSYLLQEEDLRGYVTGKGWAHSIAHGADLLAAAIRHPLFKKQDALNYLSAISTCLFKQSVYIDDEDERLSQVVDALIDRGLTDHTLNGWVTKQYKQLEKREMTLSFFKQRTNISHFMKTLYFNLKRTSTFPHSLQSIEDGITYWHDKLES